MMLRGDANSQIIHLSRLVNGITLRTSLAQRKRVHTRLQKLAAAISISVDAESLENAKKGLRMRPLTEKVSSPFEHL